MYYASTLSLREGANALLIVFEMPEWGWAGWAVSPYLYTMCGIAGIVQSSLHYSLPHLKKMTDAIAHRGPDGEGHWLNNDNQVLLGHRRLSIIDLTTAGQQPLCSPLRDNQQYERYRIIHNGEIYNYIELRDELIKKNYRFASQTDTEVILAAYDFWKDECVDYFEGMFSFAIWDEQEKKLFAARDRFGEKPFFYFFDGEQFLFASEMKALWAAGVPRIPNLRMLFNFITIGYTTNPDQPGETFFENIHKLPAASCLTYQAINKQLTLEKYWDIDPEETDKKITDEEAIEKFTALFNTSVNRRLRSDVPVGSSLSGGLDSSSIASVASSLLSQESFKSFTAIFNDFEKNESAYADKVSGYLKLEPYEITMSATDMLADWNKLCYHQEEPFGSASIYAQYKVYELAAKKNVKVLLDGQGADEILAGYPKYYKWYWQELFRKRKLFKSKELKEARRLGISDPFNFKNMIAAYFPGFATVALENQYLLKAIRHPGLTKDFVRLQSKEAYYTTPDHFTLNGVLYFNTCINGLEELLRYADRNSMAHGREVRLPFLSHELVEFVFSLPSHFKIRDAWTKWLLRKSMHDKLPPEITWRTDKTGFEPPQKKWMEDNNVREAIQEAKRKLVKEDILKKEVLDQPVVAAASHDAENFDWRYYSSAMLFGPHSQSPVK